MIPGFIYLKYIVLVLVKYYLFYPLILMNGLIE